MPVYRLQTLLDIRTKAEEEAQDAFSRAAQDAQRLKKALLEQQSALARRVAEREATIKAFLADMAKRGGGVTAFQQMRHFEDRLRDEEAQAALEIAQQKELVEEAERVLEQRRTEMAEAAMAKKAIEKHKETWAKQVRFERQQREELNQEEIGNALHLQRTRLEKKR